MSKTRATNFIARFVKSMSGLRFVLAGLLMLIGHAAQAQTGTYQCGSGYAIDPSATITVGGNVITTSADVPLNGWVGEWSSYAKTYRNWWCYAYTGTQLQPELKSTATPATPASLALDGQTYAVFTTGVTGLGIVFSWHPIYSTADTSGNNTGVVYEPSTDVPLTNAYTPNAPIWTHTGRYEPTDVGIALRARYVRIGTIPPGAVLPARSGAVLGTMTILYGTNTGPPVNAWGTNSIFLNQLQSTFPVLGCTPQTTVPVPMGTFPVSGFTGIGTTQGRRSFTIQLTGCPAAMASISFSLHPVSGAIGPASNGVAQLTPGTGVATGVGVLLTQTGSSTPLTFDSVARFVGYTGSAGNYQIPLDAAYVQTGASVGPGTANSQVEFTISYQ